VAKPNFSFVKRQKEMATKKKKEEKKQRKLAKKLEPQEEERGDVVTDGENDAP